MTNPKVKNNLSFEFELVGLTNIHTPSASPLNGTNFTSGQVPDARYSLPATGGAGFKLLQKNIVSGNLSEIQYSSSLLEENRRERRWRYVRLIVKSIIVLIIILLLFVDFDNKVCHKLRVL